MKESISVAPPSAAGVQHNSTDVRKLVLGEQVRLLYANLSMSQGVALSVAVVLAAVQSLVIELANVVAWLACFVLIAVARILLAVRFARASRSPEQISPWREYFLMGTAAAGVAWGSTAFLLYPPDAVVHQVFMAFVLGGMVTGAAALLTPLFPAFAIFALCVLLPAVVRFWFSGDQLHHAMAGMGMLFLLAMLVIGKRIHDTIRESLELRFENRELIVYLTRTRERLESANRDLLTTQEALTRSNEALESRVTERTAALQALDRRKDEFLATLSHELRNPLAPIRNAIYILTHVDPASDDANRAREVLDRQTRHLTRLVDDLLDVTRIARGRIELRRERVDLAQLVMRTAEDHCSVFNGLGVHFVKDVPEVQLWAHVDPTRIAQLVGNLLHNAAKFTPAAGEVALSLRVVDECAEIRVRDTGAGIEPELLPMLFEPFVQGKRSIARTEGGLGIGLVLVKGIVELHGGTVRAESGGPDRGSTFIVRLPWALSNADRPAPRAAVHEQSANRRVLVVDDNRDAADSLAHLVKMFGHSAEVAYDGSAAIRKACANPPDFVLCDLGLPGMTGYEVARTSRAGRRDIRLIAVTGYAQPEDITKAAAAGFDEHVRKPPDIETLRRLLV